MKLLLSNTDSIKLANQRKKYFSDSYKDISKLPNNSPITLDTPEVISSLDSLVLPILPKRK